MEGEVPECYICMDNEGVLPMGCGHVLHEECAQGQLGVHIVIIVSHNKTLAKPGDKFNATPAACGYCRQWLSHEVLDPLVDPTKSAFSDLCRKLVAADVVPGLKEAHAEVLLFSCIDDGRQPNFLLTSWTIMSSLRATLVRLFTTAEEKIVVQVRPSELPYINVGLAAGGRKENRLCPVCVAKDAESTISPCTSGHGIEYCAYKCKFCCSVANWYNGKKFFLCRLISRWNQLL
jgi:hypothetical protein